VATGILHNVGNVLNSMNISAAVVNNTLQDSRVGNLLKSLEMLEQHAEDLAGFISTDERGQRLPGYLIKLGPVLQAEQAAIADAMNVLNRSIEHIMNVVNVQQSHARHVVMDETVHPAMLMDDAIRVNQLAIEKNGVEVIREYQDIPAIILDQHRVLQILINLISNAVCALEGVAGNDRRLRLRIVAKREEAPSKISFELVDNGVGIAQESMTRIFNFGFTTRKEGHGFGLHSAANAAKEMGGAISVSSEGLGLGATFTLELPLREQRDLPSEIKTMGGLSNG
jgi:signal transduction histidine kinase